ncbi:hypothetical protein DEO72_LG11g1456 [Vigna unguiculata]|uniref:Uncharacterized protein n=1 Tax=Vigna unguiculata TaxID=3917 RepID=A0A4D6NLE1_VIGUN|nr:hypothetical protein DEO72_LG11g1456 [Vigna unguiculata]
MNWQRGLQWSCCKFRKEGAVAGASPWLRESGLICSEGLRTAIAAEMPWWCGEMDENEGGSRWWCSLLQRWLCKRWRREVALLRRGAAEVGGGRRRNGVIVMQWWPTR